MQLIVGGYTERMDENTPGNARGIGVYDFDPHEGRLRFNASVEASNPSYVVTDRARSIVYYVCEHAAGKGAAVCAHKIKPPRSGRQVRFESMGRVTLPGSHPCHVALAGRLLTVACYSSGHLITVPLSKDGSMGQLGQVFAFTSDTDRSSHIHSSVFQSALNRLLVTDLGSDKMWVLSGEGDGQFVHTPELDHQFAPLDGPRHVALHPDGQYALVNGECRGMVHLLDVSKRELQSVDRAAALPERVVEEAHGAAIRIDGKGKLVFVSDRNFNVVTTLRIDRNTGSLRFRDSTSTGGDHPRDVVLSPDGEWLLAANLKSSSISVFKVAPRGDLTHYHTFGKVPTPTSMAWL